MEIVRKAAVNWNKFAWYEENINSSKPTHRFDAGADEESRNIDIPQISLDSIKQHKIKYSFFNLSRKYDDMEIVYNTASEAVIALSNNEGEVVRRYNEDASYLPENVDLLETLYEMGIYVREDDTEMDKVHLIRKRTMVLERGVKSFIICPTYECNARCFFCFAHDDVKHSFRMTFKTADEVLDFVYRQVRKDDEVIFIWFGGEPLIAEDVIDYIIGHFDAHYKGKVKYSSVFQTNGSLLTDELLEKAIKVWHTKDFQISIEAYQQEHDKRKNYRVKNTNQYELVLKNIDRITGKGVHCLVRLHLDNRNVGDYTKILDDLLQFRDRPSFQLYTTTLHVPEHVTKFDNYVHFKQFNEFYRIIFKEMFARGFYSEIGQILPQRKMIRCVARSMNSFLIGADGKLFRCEQENHDDEHCVGDCKTGVVHNEHLAIFMDMDVNKECTGCKYMPICQGGCKYYWLRNNPDISPCVRQVHYMDTIFDMVHEWLVKNK